jgi:hypothetical protein
MFHNEGRSLRYIANYLGFSKATIFNELHRLNGEYQAELAQSDCERKIGQRGRKSSLTKNLKHLIEERFKPRNGHLNKLPLWLGLPTRRFITGLIKNGSMCSYLICLIMEYVAIALKKSVVHSVTAAQLRSVLIKSKLARNLATLKLTPCFLASIKVKLWLLCGA